MSHTCTSCKHRTSWRKGCPQCTTMTEDLNSIERDRQRREFWHRVDSAVRQVEAVSPSERVNVGCKYIPSTGEIASEEVERILRKKGATRG